MVFSLFVDMVQECAPRVPTVNQDLLALVGFWIPLALIPTGIWFTLNINPNLSQRIAPVTIVIGISGVLLAPLIVPNSDSVGLGVLLWYVLPPACLMVIGLTLAIFSGSVPVGRLRRGWRPVGFLLTGLGFMLLLAIQLEVLPRDGSSMERFWPIWWSSFVISAVLVFGGGSVIAHGTSSDAVGVRMGAQLAAISGGMLLLVLVLTIDNEDAARDLWLSAVDLIGSAIGATVAAMACFLVIQAYERSISPPGEVDPLTDAEETRLRDLLAGRGEQE